MSSPRTRAVIDVGTNSVKMLIGNVVGRQVTPLLEQSEQTRLGRGFYSDHLLRDDAIEATAAAVADFARMAQPFAPESIRVVATSAARDAVNKHDLVRAIELKSGLQVEIISGSQEAAWAFCGATLGGEFDRAAVLVMDIGGGSTELNLGSNGVNCFSHSFELGTVRLLEHFPLSDPPTAAESERCHAFVAGFIRENVAPVVERESSSLASDHWSFVATGGTATIMARVLLGLPTFDRSLLEGAQLQRQSISDHDRLFWNQTIEERRAMPGMPPKRADVILGGSAIMAAMMEICDIPKVIVSTRGLRYAALLDEACAPLA